MPDPSFMRHALELARQGQGHVEPNPMVGCVIVQENKIIGQGWHQTFGGPHAEINAIHSVGDPAELAGATLYVTLEPCSHTGKTGPCTQALIDANVARVVIACQDPNPQVSGKGIRQLRDAGIEVIEHCLSLESESLLAPYLKRTITGHPWIIAKWAMTLDGKIATGDGDSKWISNTHSREIVHQIRGRVDGIMVGIGTALADNPLLNARPTGARVATRIVVDSDARLPLDSNLVETARQYPTLIAVGPNAPPHQIAQLKQLGCDIFQSRSLDPNRRLLELLTLIAQQGMTNVLVEGGGKLLGALNDMNQIDEVHVFIGPKILGGAEAISPMGGSGHPLMKMATPLKIQKVQQIDDDIYIVARIVPNSQAINLHSGS